MQDYLSASPALAGFAGAPPSLERFAEARRRKETQFSADQRTLLVAALQRQNKDLSASETQALKALSQGAMTVVTGHQLMVGGGTAFFEFKILKTVALARRLSQEWGTPVVPVFWMASEDHDFEEISVLRIGNHRFKWECEDVGGPVGRLNTVSLSTQLEKWATTVPLNTAQRQLLESRIRAYKTHPTLAAATRAWVREWASGLGLLVLDGDDAELKTSAAPLWEAERTSQLSQSITACTRALEAEGYHAQVTPRPINLFQFRDGQRIRILSPESWPGDNCANISPNALLRPMYQEWVLPNIAYVGGGGELAYWLQLGTAFDAMQLPMPVLYLRDSVALSSVKAERNLLATGLAWDQIFQTSQEELLKQQLGYYDDLRAETERLAAPLAAAVDQWNEALLENYPELATHAAALRTKMLKLNQHTAGVRYRTIKRRESIFRERVASIYEQVYPHGVFWERRASYLDLLGALGADPRETLLANMSAIKAGTHIIHFQKD